MIKVNYYKMKYLALDNFLLWVGHGSPYTTAWPQSLYYCYDLAPETREVEEVVRIISMAVRLKKHGEPLNVSKEHIKEIWEEILEAITAYDSLDLDGYCFTEEGFRDFAEAVEEARQYIGGPAQAAGDRISHIHTYQKGEIDFYKIECEALEAFFDSLERGSSYQEAAERCTDGDHVAYGQIGEIIAAFTITLLFNVWDKSISDLFEERLKRAVEGYGELDFLKLGLTEDEIEELQGNFSEASACLAHYRRHKEEP